jgi:hypothetical protein
MADKNPDRPSPRTSRSSSAADPFRQKGAHAVFGGTVSHATTPDVSGATVRPSRPVR